MYRPGLPDAPTMHTFIEIPPALVRDREAGMAVENGNESSARGTAWLKA
jgi:hypothetical protein